ncbi:MAG: hypothetical protein A3J67_00945 [Parcubacteria group bacterium RIFCSPHIGHO2_02_FULL_48_10b]|nr:MAG: hypothetical protein A3J67_00945 [Parcubacteria group bacterium RIFCSPHIGHO2_02_FULL_48_10b]
MKQRLIAGFTVAETLVAMSLFIAVVSIAVDGFIRNLRTQRATVILISANSNASAALEQMAREIRVGRNFPAPATKPGVTSIAFTNSAGETVAYQLDVANQAIERGVDPGTGMVFSPITAEDVGVLDLRFILFGTNPTDGYPPRITITLRITPVGIVGLSVPIINMQTTVSARELDG